MKRQNYSKARVRDMRQTEMAARATFAHGYDLPDPSIKKPIDTNVFQAMFAKILNVRALRSAFTSL